MGISGSDHALMYAQSGVARFGATRSGWCSPTVFVTVNGTLIEPSGGSAKVLLGSLTITDELDERPNRLAMTVAGTTPTKGQEVIITLGSVNNPSRLFAGQILEADRVMVEHTDTILHRLHAIDYTWLGDRRLVTTRYINQSATDIARAIVSGFTAGFTANHVAAGLATVDEITFTNESVSGALTRLAKRIGGYWYWDYVKDLHFFVTETESPPVDLTTAHASLMAFEHVTDLSQVVTRVYAEGYGSPAALPVAIGSTTLPVVDKAVFSTGGGEVVSGPQRITYTGVGARYTAVDTWQPQTEGAASNWQRAVWAPELSLWVAVASSGSNRVMTSSDGVSWSPQSAAAANTWAALTWSPALGLFVAVSQDGANRVMTSSNGTSWSSASAAEANTWRSVTWSPALGLFVAVSSDGANRVMTSSNGTSWSSASAASATTWVSVVWSAELALFVAVANNGGSTSTVMTSANGTTWAIQTASTAAVWNQVVWAAELGLFVAVAQGGVIMTSPNGTAWTTRLNLGSSDNWTSVAWGTDLKLVAVMNTTAGAPTQQILISPDGITWGYQTSPRNGAWNYVAWSPDLAQFVALGNTGSLQVMTNTNAVIPQLTGIPTSGVGSIQYALAAGDDVNILETVNDAGAQAALAALLGTGDGVVEEFLQDRRLSAAEAVARGTATILLRSAAEESITYRVRDLRTTSGKAITVNVAGVTGTFKIQQVVLSGFNNDGLYPTFQVSASSTRFSLDDLLRTIRRKAAIS